MKKHLCLGALLSALLAFPQAASASGGYSQTVGLHTLLGAKLGSTTSKNSAPVQKSPVSVQPQSLPSQTLPTKTLPTQTQTIVQEFVQPVVQPIQQIIQPVVKTVIQPVITQTVAQPIYSQPSYLAPIYQGSSSVDLGGLMSGNPFLQGGMSIGKFGGHSGSSYVYSVSGYSGSGYSGSGYSGSGKGQANGSVRSSGSSGKSHGKGMSSVSFAPRSGFGGFGGKSAGFGGFSRGFGGRRSFDGFGGGFGGFGGGFGRSGFGGFGGFGQGFGFSAGPSFSSFSIGNQGSFAFGGAAFGGPGSVGINVGNNVVTLPGFESLGFPKPGESLQRVFNYSAGFDVGPVRYTVEVSSRLTASFTGPSASPSSVKSI
jgi:hypothetical protein